MLCAYIILICAFLTKVSAAGCFCENEPVQAKPQATDKCESCERPSFPIRESDVSTRARGTSSPVAVTFVTTRPSLTTGAIPTTRTVLTTPPSPLWPTTKAAVATTSVGRSSLALMTTPMRTTRVGVQTTVDAIQTSRVLAVPMTRVLVASTQRVSAVTVPAGRFALAIPTTPAVEMLPVIQAPVATRPIAPQAPSTTPSAPIDKSLAASSDPSHLLAVSIPTSLPDLMLSPDRDFSSCTGVGDCWSLFMPSFAHELSEEDRLRELVVAASKRSSQCDVSDFLGPCLLSAVPALNDARSNYVVSVSLFVRELEKVQCRSNAECASMIAFAKSELQAKLKAMSKFCSSSACREVR